MLNRPAMSGSRRPSLPCREHCSGDSVVHAHTNRPAPPVTGSGLSLWIGGGLVVLGVVVNVVAAVQHIRLLRRLERGEQYRTTTWSLGVVVTLLLAAIGVMMTAYLFLGSY